VIGPSATKALARLCPKLPASPKRVQPTGKVPAVVATTEREVESIRGLRFEHPVAVAAVTRSEMAARLDKQSADTLPIHQIRRQGLAWQTIGVIPAGIDLVGAARRFLDTQVVGYYDERAKELVYVGSTNPTPAERFTLAHELTHALEDQHFDLSRLDRLQARCLDDEQEAATGTVEGTATFFSVGVLDRYFTPSEQHEVAQATQGTVPRGVPQFLVDMVSWAYTVGPEFIASRYRSGGVEAVNDVLRQWPLTTSEVMHPETYPGPPPPPLDIPQLAHALGKGWRDLDVEQAGEQWLEDLLGPRLDPAVAGAAAAGWDGGVYRAWTDGKHVAVLLRTRWTSVGEAQQFARDMNSWIRSNQSAKVRVTGSVVDVLFASDSATLTQLESASGQ
jgi:hypothetical protein